MELRNFQIDTSNISASGETREITISGDVGATFSLEIFNEDNSYYNFNTNVFQTTKTRLSNITLDVSNTYTANVVFPVVTDADKYTVYLFAENYPNTTHTPYIEARALDGTVDINASTGSTSAIIKKEIYQTLDTTITISAVSPNSLTDFGSMSVTTQTITATEGQSLGTIPFSISVTSASTKAFRINNQPQSQDLITLVSRDIGSVGASNPIKLNTENVYPAITNTDTIDGAVTSGIKVVMDSNVASKMTVGDRITTALTSDTVNGNVEESDKIIMDNAVAGKMAVGDRVSGIDLFDSGQFFVRTLNPDGDNANEFQVGREQDDGNIAALEDPSVVIVNDGVTLKFSSRLNRTTTTVAALNPDTDNVKEFSMSQAIQLRDGATLSFSIAKNFRWAMDNVYGLTEGTLVTGTNVTTGTFISSYNNYITREGQARELVESAPGIDTAGNTASFSRNATSNRLTITQAGEVVFNQQQIYALGGDTVNFIAKTPEAIKTLTGYEVSASNLKVEIADVTTTTTSGVSNSTTVPVASGDGIMEGVSTVSGIGIDPAAIDPTVSTINSYSGTTASLILSAAQTLENGITLKFSGAGETITITGDLTINRVGSEDITLSLDLEKFITATNEAS